MKALILEDEQLASSRLKRMLAEVAKDIKVVAVFETIVDTKSYLKDHRVDILFLDIHVADGNSFELFDLENIDAQVIFVTAYDKYAIEAFRKNAIDYLLKPLKKSELAEAVEKLTQALDKKRQNDREYPARIVIDFMSKIQSLRSDQIAYVYSKNKISYFHLWNGQKYASSYKLQELEEMLDPSIFFRANRQFIIHIDSIDQINKHLASRLKLKLKPFIDIDLIISTDKTPIFKKWLES